MAFLAFLASPHPAPVIVAAGVAGLMVLGSRWRPGVPYSVIGVAAATLAATVTPHLELLGPLPAGLPTPSLAFHELGAWPRCSAPGWPSLRWPPWRACSAPRWPMA